MTTDELKALIPTGPYVAPQPSLGYTVWVKGKRWVLTIILPDPKQPRGFVLLRGQDGPQQFIANITLDGIIIPGPSGARAMLDRLEDIEQRSWESEYEEDPFDL